ncbi:Gfo/Idh/MocA family protein [Microbacterium sp.]|uniref:Gfo/Idh/MocA family protein n=1 Tax=Microbacterium sp. TaxID=51671 RepID=UPI0028117E0D|nr:Gfo/Idh/MocA family oxidoreductase [Microbacterium sp.]
MSAATVLASEEPIATGEEVRAGFVGGGFMAAVHSRAARAAGARLVGVRSSNLASSQGAADRLGIEMAAETIGEVIAASDIVHICTPNGQHVVQALEALNAGCHVICEKPLATSVEEARMVAGMVDAAGLIGAVPFVYRYHPMVRRARRIVADGQVGDVLTIDGSYLQDWLSNESDTNWRADLALGGSSRAFADIGSHLCDLLEFVTGSRIRAVVARTRTVFPTRNGERVQNEDVVAVLAEMGDGALATLLVSQLAPGRKNGLVLELHGTRRSMRFEQENPEQLWLGAADGSQLLMRDPQAAGDRGLSLLPPGHPMGYQDAFNAFVADVYAATRGESPDGMPTFADGARAAVLTEAVLASAQSGAWVEVANA